MAKLDCEFQLLRCSALMGKFTARLTDLGITHIGSLYKATIANPRGGELRWPLYFHPQDGTIAQGGRGTIIGEGTAIRLKKKVGDILELTLLGSKSGRFDFKVTIGAIVNNYPGSGAPPPKFIWVAAAELQQHFTFSNPTPLVKSTKVVDLILKPARTCYRVTSAGSRVKA